MGKIHRGDKYSKIAFFRARLFLKFFYSFYSNRFKKNISKIHMYLKGPVINSVTTHFLESSHSRVTKGGFCPFARRIQFSITTVALMPRLFPQTFYLVEDPLVLNKFIGRYKNSGIKWNICTHKKLAGCSYMYYTCIWRVRHAKCKRVQRNLNFPVRESASETRDKRFSPLQSLLSFQKIGSSKLQNRPLRISLIPIWTNSGLSETLLEVTLINK